MFHTFQTTAAAVSQAQSRNNPKTRRQSSTTQACEECRRRKIRCDGKQPCSHCEWYKHPKLCRYSKKQPRVVPSQKLLDELSNSLKQSQRVVESLFPNKEVKDLGEMPRHELIDLILSLPASQPASSAQTSPVVGQDPSQRYRVKSEEAQAPLDVLEEEPAGGYWDETQNHSNGVPAIPDDVNALSMSVHRQSSYVGVSSVAAALRVISKITTAMESVIDEPPKSANQLHPEPSPNRPDSSGDQQQQLLSATALSAPSLHTPVIKTPSLATSVLVDAYFTHVHPMIPMIDEQKFRADVAADTRRDAAWLALLNVVYAMGTIAAGTADDNSHLHYYKLAKQHLGLEMLGSGSIETVQALGILGGYYLHYESKPNMANAVMGAALRMACALGLHREYSENSSTDEKSTAKDALLIPREVRRRTWWSLFCLDTWALTATGRPSLGRTSAGVNVAFPSPINNKIDNPGSETTDDDVFVMLLCAQAGFCKIATRVQDRLAECPLLPAEETQRFDAELRHWYNNLPTMLRWPEPCPDKAKTPRAVLSWRYHNLRLVLHRPMLLNNALRSSLENPDKPTEEELRIVNNCRKIAGEAIEDIKNQWEASQIAGWNAVWLLFQAAMVPLVTLFAEYNRSNFEAVRDAQVQVQSVIDQLEVMQDWSITAKRSRDVVGKIFERNKLLVSHAREVMEQQRKKAKEEQRKRQQERRDKEREQAQQQQVQQQQAHQQQQHRRSVSQSRSSQSPMQTPRTHTHTQQNYSPSHIGMGFVPFKQHHNGSQMIATQNMANMYSSHGSVSPPSAHSMEPQQMAILPDGLMPPPQQNGGLADHMGMNMNGTDTIMTDGSHPGTNYINEDELNAFWNQIMWGDADMNNFVMDQSLEALPAYGQEHPHGANGAAYGF